MSWNKKLRGLCEGFARGGEFKDLRRNTQPPARARKSQAPAPQKPK